MKRLQNAIAAKPPALHIWLTPQFRFFDPDSACVRPSIWQFSDTRIHILLELDHDFD
jgi:hypothetical protein